MVGVILVSDAILVFVGRKKATLVGRRRDIDSRERNGHLLYNKRASTLTEP
jgi:hypothetical protein